MPFALEFGRWEMWLLAAALVVVLSLAVSTRLQERRKWRQSESKLRALLDAAPDSAMLLDRNGKLIAINAIGAGRFKKLPEEIEGQNFFDMIPPAVAQARREAVDRVVVTGTSTIVLDQRDRYFLENRIYPLVGDNGQAEGVAVFSRDITEKHQTEVVNSLFQQLDRMLLDRRVSFETLARRVCEELLALFDLSVVWIGVKESDYRVRRIAGAEASHSFLNYLDEVEVRWDNSPQGDGPTGRAIRTGRIQSVKAEDIRVIQWKTGSKASGISDGLSFPITIRGSIWGALTMYSKVETPFLSEESRSLLETIADRLSLIFDTARQQEQLHLLETALASASNAAFITDTHGLILWCNRALVDLTGYPEYDLIGQTPRVFKYGKNNPDDYLQMWQTILAGQVWKGELVDQRRDGSLYTVRQTVTPMRNDEGRTTHFITIQEDVTEQRNTQRHIEHLANYDPLTDLPNRNLFFDRLQQAQVLARRNGDGCALLFLDLDHFKEVNDHLGHQAGDELLKEVALRLKSQVRESDTVARLAGDEFTVILTRPGSREDLRLIADKIVAAIGSPYRLSADRVVSEVGVSIGIALYPADGEDSDTLVRCADQAMYAAKAAGRSRYCFSEANSGNPGTLLVH